METIVRIKQYTYYYLFTVVRNTLNVLIHFIKALYDRQILI